MTDITELAQREKFEAWAHSQKLSLAYGDCGYAFSSTEMAWRAWMASSAELVEALDLKEEQRANWFQMAQKLGDNLDAAEKRNAELVEALEKAQRAQPCEHSMFWDASGVKRCSKCDRAELESRTVTVKLPDDEDGQAYGFGKWANGKLPATAGTMTIAYCEDAWRAAFVVFSSAAGIKVEAD
ncbi:TPA: hypothetical protein ACK8T7_004374 [Klebsiella aerogenes]